MHSPLGPKSKGTPLDCQLILNVSISVTNHNTLRETSMRNVL